MRTGREPCRHDRGASLVEFALLAPLLVMLLLGMVTGGFALATKNSMTNAVREGARVGATLPGGGDWDTWAASVKNRVVELAGGDLEDGDVCSQIINASDGSVLGQYPSTGCTLSMATPADPSTTTSGCVVKVWAERDPATGRGVELNALLFTRSLDLKAKAVGRYERQADCP